MNIGFIDPGRSTGIAWGHHTDTTPLTLDGYAQVDGGLLGLLIWLGDNETTVKSNVWYAEKYVPYSAIQTVDSTYPLIVEGGLITAGVIPDHNQAPERWRPSKHQYWVSGGKAAQKRQKQERWIKDNHPDLYVTGSNVGAKDADDVRSAIFHLLSLMRAQNHKPTMAHYWPDEN